MTPGVSCWVPLARCPRSPWPQKPSSPRTISRQVAPLWGSANTPSCSISCSSKTRSYSRVIATSLSPGHRVLEPLHAISRVLSGCQAGAPIRPRYVLPIRRVLLWCRVESTPSLALARGFNTSASAVATSSVALMISRLAVPLAGTAAAFVADGVSPRSSRSSAQMLGSFKIPAPRPSMARRWDLVPSLLGSDMSWGPM